MFCRRVPAGWLEAYTAANYNQISPALRLVRRTNRPFVWADAPYDAEREPRIAEYLQYMADFGLDKGLMIPVHRVTGRMGIVWFSGPAPTFNAHNIPALQLIALLAFEHIRRFQAPPYELRRSMLTAREREVLSWVAAGKTAWEIGEILQHRQAHGRRARPLHLPQAGRRNAGACCRDRRSRPLDRRRFLIAPATVARTSRPSAVRNLSAARLEDCRRGRRKRRRGARHGRAI